MTKHKLKKLLEGIEIGWFDTCKNWGDETNGYYYKYFNDMDNEIRGGSILAFASMLGNWYHGSADVFRTTQGITYIPKEQFYFIDDYLSAFLKNDLHIREDFPILHSYILFFLYNLDKRKPFELVFPLLDQKLLNKMRTQLFINKENIPTNYIDLPEFNNLLREVGLPTFFSD